MVIAVEVARSGCQRMRRMAEPLTTPACSIADTGVGASTDVASQPQNGNWADRASAATRIAAPTTSGSQVPEVRSAATVEAMLLVVAVLAVARVATTHARTTPMSPTAKALAARRAAVRAPGRPSKPMSATVEALTASQAAAISHGRPAKARRTVDPVRALAATKKRSARASAASDRPANVVTTTDMVVTNTAMPVPKRSRSSRPSPT